jgi:esterase/lipase
MQKWYSNQKIIIVGVSFGAIFVPATYHLAKNNNVLLSNCVLAYAGADLYEIFLNAFKNYKIFKKPLAFFANELFKDLDPKYHLNYITSKMLIINGMNDEYIPKKSVELLQKNAPSNKTIINLDSKHIQPEKNSLLNKVEDITLKWIENNQ